MSELMRSESCQSGPCSRITTFLPALASTSAKVVPDAPAPTMTTSTFSVAMSPPPGRGDVRHVWNAEAGITIHGAVDDIDRVAAQQQINERSGRALPVGEFVLSHRVDEGALVFLAELRKPEPVVAHPADAIDRPEGRTIEIGVGRADVEDARFKQRLFGRDGDLLIDEMSNAGVAGPRYERFADRLEGLGLCGGERPQRDALGARRARRAQDLHAAYAECERAERRATHECASFDIVHDFLR